MLLENNKGIQFYNGTFEETLLKAQKEKKLIFLDGYTSWCAPCKMMNTTVFTQPEVGQFFTPRILTRFIVQSIPIKEMIKEKILSGDKDFIPKVIDFACGSGHFLTEAMDIIQKSLLEIGKENLDILKRVEDVLNRYNNDPDKFIWAKDYIYGIENDYRLVKTTKLSCFFNGDGEAQILQTSGIYPFSHDDVLSPPIVFLGQQFHNLN